MIEALKRYMPDGIAWTEPQGGFYVWLTFPESVDTFTLLPKALENKVAYVIGSAFSAAGDLKNTLRLSFSHESEAVIEEGVRRLAETIRNKGF
jgi:2-aminoadipate transaminase